MSIKIRSRIETLAERLVRRTRITCSEMPQALTEKQLHLLRFIVVHGRVPGGITQLQSMLGVVEQGFNALAAPLYERKLIERVSLKELRQKSDAASEGLREKGRGLVGLIVTRKGAEYIAKVENTEISIEDCILEKLDGDERDRFIELLSKATSEGDGTGDGASGQGGATTAGASAGATTGKEKAA